MQFFKTAPVLNLICWDFSFLRGLHIFTPIFTGRMASLFFSPSFPSFLPFTLFTSSHNKCKPTYLDFASFLQLSLGVSNPTRNPTNPSNPPEPKPTTAQTDHSDGRWRVSASKTWRRQVEWRVFFSETRATRPDRRYTNLTIFGEIQARFGEIRQDSRRSRLILAIFGADLLGFCRFQRIYWRFRLRFGVFLLRYREFCKNRVTIWCFFA